MSFYLPRRQLLSHAFSINGGAVTRLAISECCHSVRSAHTWRGGLFVMASPLSLVVVFELVGALPDLRCGPTSLDDSGGVHTLGGSP